MAAMSVEDVRYKFSVISEQVATLAVWRSSSSFGLTLDATQQVYRLGMFARPMFELRQPFSPDERWFVTATGAEAFPPNDDPLENIEQEYAIWAQGSRAPDSQGALRWLPVGEYSLVRFQKNQLSRSTILMGNEFVPAEPNMIVICDKSPFYACIVGARNGMAPDLNQPLVGVVVLNYDGSSSLDCTLFFSCGRPRPADVDDDLKDLVAVIPMSGKLVIDNMGPFSAEQERRSRERWGKSRVCHFKDILAAL
jgi:hypothetical protein